MSSMPSIKDKGEKKGSSPLTTEAPDEDSILGKTVMDIDLQEGGEEAPPGTKGRGNEPLTHHDKSGESVEALLKKEKSLLNRLGLGRLFRKKKG